MVMQSRHVLMIEADLGDADRLRRRLETITSIVYRLEHAPTLRQGLDKIQSRPTANPVDVVLLDWSLPDGGGTAAIERLRQASPAPIVVLSPAADEAIAAQVRQAGAADHLVKGSTDEASLHRIIDYAVERRQLREQLLAAQQQCAGALKSAADGPCPWDLGEKLLNEQALTTTVLQSIGEGIIIVDRLGAVQFLNAPAEQLTGWTLEQASDQFIERVFPICDGETGERLPNLAAQARQENRRVSFSPSAVLLSNSQHQHVVDASAIPIHASTGDIIGSVVVFRDVSEAQGQAQQLSWQTSHDALTGLLNRRAFGARVQDALDSARLGSHCPILCHVDLDHFKVVNDACGHAAGDELLRQVAELLLNQVRNTDTVARLGSDEFGIVLYECPLERAVQIAHSICSALIQCRFSRHNRVFKMSCSIGLSAIDQTAHTADRAMHAASVACYAAKHRGRNRIHIYQPEDQRLSQYSSETQWFTRLSNALENNQFQLFYQLISESGDRPGSDRHCEVLLRLVDEQGQLISPAAFIPAAERYSLMPEIDRWVIRHCFEYLSDCLTCSRQRGASCDYHVSPATIYAINLSGDSIDDDCFLEFIQDQLKRYCIPPQIICFEITETAAISNLKGAVDFIEQLKQVGCRFALDDFGTGMSSLAYLRTLPVDYLKIDGSFIRDIADDQIACAMVEAVNSVAHLMGLRTVAEFVSSAELLEKVKSLGVDYMQGYAIAMPTCLTVPSPEVSCTASATAVPLKAGSMH